MSKGARFTLEQVRTLSADAQAQIGLQLKEPVQAVFPAIPAPPSTKTPTKPTKRAKTQRTRNGGAWTEAMFWQAVRSGLRAKFRFWKPAIMALNAARTPYGGKHGAKWAYLCADCGRLFRRKGVQIDHAIPCGKLSCFEDIPGFLERMTPEDPKAFSIRCLKCHAAKTAVEREARKE